MSDLPTGRGEAGAPRLLGPVTVALLLVVGLASFAAMLLLGAYAPDLGGGSNGGGHALSNAVHGYNGVVRLAEATGRNPRVTRDPHLFGTEDLLVATPENGAVNVGTLLGERGGRPTLLVLPKWDTARDAEKRGWATVSGLKGPWEPQGVLSPAVKFKVDRRRSGGRPLLTVGEAMTGVRFTAPRPLQTIDPASARTGAYGPLEPLVVDERGGIVVGRFAERPLFVLADPDLLDNRGMRGADNARSALALLDFMNSNEAEGIAFDVSLNGLAKTASPLKLAFEPPFLATTLALMAALLIAALGTVTRFGSPRPRERAIAFGKRALVDNTAALVRKAGREAKLGGRYVEVVREAAVRAFGVPARLRGAELDAYLDRVGRGERFTTLAGAATKADDTRELLGAAQALHGWMEGRRR